MKTGSHNPSTCIGHYQYSRMNVGEIVLFRVVVSCRDTHRPVSNAMLVIRGA